MLRRYERYVKAYTHPTLSDTTGTRSFEREKPRLLTTNKSEKKHIAEQEKERRRGTTSDSQKKAQNTSPTLDGGKVDERCGKLIEDQQIPNSSKRSLLHPGQVNSIRCT